MTFPLSSMLLFSLIHEAYSQHLLSTFVIVYMNFIMYDFVVFSRAPVVRSVQRAFRNV